MRLSANFTLDELTHSQAAARLGLRNVPGPAQVEALRMLVTTILQPLRSALGRPIVVSSGFRAPAVNVAVGGARSSQHTRGEAVDFIVPGMTVAEVVEYVRSLQLPFDQLIDEFGSWVHVSYGPKRRREVLKARRVDGRTVYTRGAD